MLSIGKALKVDYSLYQVHLTNNVGDRWFFLLAWVLVMCVSRPDFRNGLNYILQVYVIWSFSSAWMSSICFQFLCTRQSFYFWSSYSPQCLHRDRHRRSFCSYSIYDNHCADYDFVSQEKEGLQVCIEQWWWGGILQQYIHPWTLQKNWN